MKKVLKELFRFILVVIVTTLILLPSILHPDTLIVSFTTLLLFFILSIVLACLHKISKAWVIDITIFPILIIILYFLISFLANVFEADSKIYSQILDDFIKTPINIPDESVFNGMKRYAWEDWDNEDAEEIEKGIMYDKSRNPIDGVVVKETPISALMISGKNGKREGYALAFDKRNGKKTLITTVYVENNKMTLFQLFYKDGTLKTDNHALNNYVLKRSFYSNKNPMIYSISIKNIGNIVSVYNKQGQEVERINTVNNSSICLKNDGTTRTLTPKEIDNFFKINDRLVNDVDFEPNFHCE